VLAQEIAIWAIVGLALLLVAAMIWRGEPMPKIETSADDKRPDHRHTQVGDAARLKLFDAAGNFDERARLAIARYGNDGGGQPIGPPSQSNVDVGDTKKVEAPEASSEGAAGAAGAPTSAKPSK
jgi:hypothetical protein